MDKNKCSSCGEAPHKCSCKNKEFTKAVVEINNPEQITLMRKVVIPTSMGDDTTVPPVVGKYHNVLLYYEANQKSYLYSSDGIPTQLVNGLTDYEAAVNLPQINGNTLIGDKTGEELGLQDKLTAGDNITIENDVISATDTTYGPATDTEIGLVKPGDGLEVDTDGTMSVSGIEQYAHFFDTVADMKQATNLVNGSYARTGGFYAVDDEGGALYFITNTSSNTELQETLSNGLYATIVGKNIKTGQIGLEANDSTKALTNFSKLMNVIDKDYSIIVDNKYYLDATESYTSTATEINIKGIKDKGEFIINPSEELTLMNVNNCQNINVEDMKFTNQSVNVGRFFRLVDTSLWHIDNFNFINNEVNGSISVIDGGYATNLTPVLGTHGFNYIKIIGNRFNNLTKVSCFNLFDTIAKKIEIKDNYVHNFTNKFFGLTITNGSGHEEEIGANIVMTEIDNNYVYCDETYTETSSSNAAYYCFVLLEGNTCRYTNNHVEGLKSTQTIALYDAYLSVTTLYSFNNVFKNNMLFATGDNCYLIKSKGAPSVTNMKRYYRGNTYIIEEDWQKIFDPTLSKPIAFIDVLQDETCLEYELTDCYFDIVKLRGRQGGYPIEFGKFVVKNNYIHFKHGDGEGRYLFCAKTKALDDTIYIENNTIINDDQTITLFGAILLSSDYKKIDKVYIDYNEFVGSELINRCNVNELQMTNNNFKLSRNGSVNRVIYDTNSQNPTLIMKNNNIKLTPNIESYMMLMSTGSNLVDIKNEWYARFPNSNNQGFIFAGNIDTNSVYRYFFEYEIQHTTGKQVMSFYVDYGKDDTGNYVKVIDNNNTEQTVYLTGSNTDLKVNNATSITTSGARLLINSNRFLIIPSFNYSINNKPYFVKQIVKSVQLS